MSKHFEIKSWTIPNETVNGYDGVRIWINTRPPTSNNMYVNRKKGRAKSSEYQRWRDEWMAILKLDRGYRPPLRGPLFAHYRLLRHRRNEDCQNREKALSDLLTASGWIEDDKQIEFLTIRWERTMEEERLPSGGTLIELKRINESIAGTVATPKFFEQKEKQRGVTLHSLVQAGLTPWPLYPG